MTPTIRRRPLDAPGCAAWNEAVRRARTEYAAHPLTPWCEWPESEEPCYSRACRGGLCSSHLGLLVKRREGAA